MEEYRADIEAILYRMRKLDEKYEKIKWLVSGTGNSYIELLLTQKENLSKNALDAMIDELISCMEAYRSYKAAQDKGFGVRMDSYRLPDDERVFYRSYFYLLIGLSLEQNSGPVTPGWSRPGTWDAMIERANYPVTYKTMAELDRDLLNHALIGGSVSCCPCRFPEGLFYDILCAYRNVMGEGFTAHITKQEREAAYKLMTDDERYFITHPKEADRLAKEEHEATQQLAVELGYIGDDGDLSPEDIFDDGYMYYDAEAGGWTSFFGDDRERFDKSCQIVRRMYCDIAVRGNMKDDVTSAINFYLGRKGVSKWGDDDSFFDVYTYMNKALKASRKHMGI